MTEPHPAFTADLIERLRTVVGSNGAGPAPAPTPPDAATGPSVRARHAAKRVVRRAIAWYVDDVAQETADRAVAALAGELRQHDEIPVLKVNQELLKGEVRALLETVEELGMAIAPATGIEGASARMAELREGLHALEARLRRISPPAPAAATAAAPPPAADPPQPALAGFDYAGFERRFRGDAEVILAELKSRYLDLLRPHAPVLDVGCGRGELLAALVEEGLEATGVDSDAEMVTEALERGVDVHLGDALAYLRSVPDASLGSVVAIQVLEHLPFSAVLELIELVRTRLRPGGLFVAETPNPASLVVLGNSYILDPTHVRPLHPSLLAFLCESAGFRDVRLSFWAPAEDYQLKPIDDPDAPPWAEQVNAAFAQLNQVLFGPQDYAVVATTPP
jgi:SAM-dependent methyltransferase